MVRRRFFPHRAALALLGAIAPFTASVVLTALVLVAAAAPARALPSGPEGWIVLHGEAGQSVDFPSALFPLEAGPTERGTGKKFRSRDGAAEFALYFLDNKDKDSPSAWLKKNLIVPPQSMIYRRVAPDFFALSSIRDGRIYYSRCNFSAGIHCIYVEYPQGQKRAFDAIVTRVSGSLKPR